MNCQTCQSMLIDLLYDELSAEEKREAKEHLDSCHLCARELRELKKTIHLARTLKDPELPPFINTRIAARAQEAARHAAHPRSFFARVARPAMLLAASIAIAISVLYVLPAKKADQGAESKEKLVFNGPTAQDERKWGVPAPRKSDQPRAASETKDSADLERDQMEVARTESLTAPGGATAPSAPPPEAPALANAGAGEGSSVAIQTGASMEGQQPGGAAETEDGEVTWIAENEPTKGARSWSPSLGEEDWAYDRFKNETMLEPAPGQTPAPENVFSGETIGLAALEAGATARSAEAETLSEIGLKSSTAKAEAVKVQPASDAAAKPLEPSELEAEIASTLKNAKKAEDKGNYNAAFELYRGTIEKMGYLEDRGRLLPAIKPSPAQAPAEAETNLAPACTPQLKQAAEGAIRSAKKSFRLKSALDLERWYRRLCP